MTMRIRYTGGPRGLASLVGDLERAGLSVDYSPPTEGRGGVDLPAVVVIAVGAFAAGALQKAGSDAYDAVARKVVETWRERKHGDAVIERESQVDSVAGSE